jgi:hypothetical protein
MSEVKQMRLKGEFIVREVAGETIVIPVGKTTADFNGIICLNASGELIWKELQDGKNKDDIVETIVAEFEVSREEAAEDLASFLQQLRDNDLLET